MLFSRLLGAVFVLSCSFVSISVNAETIPGGGYWDLFLEPRDLDGNTSTIEAYYDPIMNMTWLADVNYAKTQWDRGAADGLLPEDRQGAEDGLMTWVEAMAWVDTLGEGGYTNWRLPSVSPVDGISFNTRLTTDATSDVGYAEHLNGWEDVSHHKVSELGNMFYSILGNLGRCDPYQPFCDEQPNYGLSITGPFDIPTDVPYWANSGWLEPNHDFSFDFTEGKQEVWLKLNTFHAWAVHDGSLGASIVPIPAAVWLFGSGLIGLIGVARRNKT